MGERTMSFLPKILVFDFDGVLVDSNEMKYQAWLELFPHHQDFMRDVLSTMYYHTRFVILRHINERVGAPEEKQKKESWIRDYAEKYNAIVGQGVSRLGCIPGVCEALEFLSLKYRLFINSGTIEESLQESVRDLGISHFFVRVFGASRTKAENLARIMYQERASSHEIVMIGDGDPDYSAARHYGIFFIGVTNTWNGWANKEFPLVSHIADITPIIKAHFAKKKT
ncbi:MAG: HAD family hydrolase [Candidatus Colwellbacteria bacterium]|nr:HAD family hydrolase [Candidatus Colwellbacteria bacterium]